MTTFSMQSTNYSVTTQRNATQRKYKYSLKLYAAVYHREFVGQYQAEFMGERATTDLMFAIRQVLQKYRDYNVPTHHLFIDFKSAYDAIDREQLWQIMHEYGFPEN